MVVTVVGKETHRMEYNMPVTLMEACRDAGETFYAPCGGGGTCGKCKVRILSGEASEPASREITALGADAMREGWRLACLATASGDVTFMIPGAAPLVNTETTVENVGSGTAVAVDIGTTTLAAALIEGGRVTATASALNPQAVYGADVLSRISYGEANGTDEMTSLVRDAVRGLISELRAPDGVPAAIVGNTVMLHLYGGLDPTPIGRYPFTPRSLFGIEKDGEYLAPCVSGYVGADAVAAAYASGMTKTDEPALLCDIGTNGEILYWDGERLTAAAAASGPALEGAGISCGTVAASGAIDSVKLENGRLKCHVIGDAVPRGICGGGLIDAVACLYELGIIDESGYMEDPCDLGGVTLTPGDVRAFQLAKGAIRAAIEVLTAGKNITAVYVSGGFGSGISVASAVKTGLFPESFREKVRFIGNGALSGAVMMASSSAAREEVRSLAEAAEYVELSLSPEFSSLFIEHLEFPEKE